MVIYSCGFGFSQIWRGESGSITSRMEMKWFLNVRICLSVTSLLWFPGGTIFQLMLLLSISFCSNCGASLSKRCSLGLNNILVR